MKNNFIYCVCVFSHFSRVRFFATPWTVAHQTPLSLDFPGKNTGVGCHALLQGNLPNSGIEPMSLESPALTGGFFSTSAIWEAPGWMIKAKVINSSLSMENARLMCTCLHFILSFLPSTINSATVS